MTANSKVALLCCVSADPRLNPQTMIALDYCHKIKCYFGGITEDEVKHRLLKSSADTQGVIEMARAHRLREIGNLYETFWRIKANRLKRGRNASASPKTTVTMEGLKERALQISRMSEDPSGSTSEEKRLTIILLKEIEMYLASRVGESSNVTPMKSLMQIKSQSHLRMRTGSASRSSTSLHGGGAPYLMVNQSSRRVKVFNQTSSQQKSRSQSRQRHVHMIPTANQDYDIRSHRRSRQRSKQTSHKQSKASSTSRSPNIKKKRGSSKNSLGSRIVRPGSSEL